MYMLLLKLVALILGFKKKTNIYNKYIYILRISYNRKTRKNIYYGKKMRYSDSEKKLYKCVTITQIVCNGKYFCTRIYNEEKNNLSFLK